MKPGINTEPGIDLGAKDEEKNPSIQVLPGQWIRISIHFLSWIRIQEKTIEEKTKKLRKLLNVKNTWTN